MALLTLPLRLPFLPIQTLIMLAELLQEEAERELNDPARIRRELEEAEWQRVRGEISDEDLSRIQEEVVRGMVRPRPADAGFPPQEQPQTQTGTDRDG
jgi:hypothetical protein